MWERLQPRTFLASETCKPLDEQIVEAVGINRVDPVRIQGPIRNVPKIDGRMPKRQFGPGFNRHVANFTFE